MTSETHEIIEIGDPFDHFVKQAYKYSSKLNISCDFAHEALAIIRGAFGEDWFANEFSKMRRGSPIDSHFAKHPLVGNILVSGMPQIIEIFELAIYLKRLFHIKNVEKVTAQMKSQYAESFMQLAYGYRFFKLGCKNLEFEPAAIGGRLGDIYFELDGKSYMVECYIPRETKKTDSLKELQFLIGPIFDYIISKKKILRISIKLKKNISHKERKNILSSVKGGINKQKAKDSVLVEDENATIVVDDVSDMSEDTDFSKPNEPMACYENADAGVRRQMVSRSELDRVRSGEYLYKEIDSRIFFWRPASEKSEISLGERAEVLTKKLEKKLAQTKKSDKNTRRVIVAQIEEGRQAVVERDERYFKICRKIQENIVTKHKNISAIFVSVRSWTVASRYVFIGMGLLGREEDTFARDFLNKLSEMEYKVDFLKDWR